VVKIIKKYRALVIVSFILLAIFSAFQLPELTINPRFDEYIPKEVGNRAYLNKLDSIFGGNEKILLILTTNGNIINPRSFKRINNITNELTDLEGVERCLSLNDIIEIKQEDGITTLAPIVEKISNDPEKRKTLEQSILKSKTGQRFISSDLSSTAIIISKSDDVEDNIIIPAIEKIIKNNPGPEYIYIGGLSYLRYSIKSYIKKDLFTLLPAALLLMLLMLYFSFREWKGVVLPFVVVVLSILYSFGVMALKGWEISLVSVLLPIMLIAIANDYGIHLINLYQERSRLPDFHSMKKVSVEIYQDLRKPVLITGLTTIGGMLGLLSHKMPPAAQLGLLAATGIAFALLMSLILIPVLLSFYKKPDLKPQHSKLKISLIDKILRVFSRWVIHHPRNVVISFSVVAFISLLGLFLLRVDTNVEGYFSGKSDIRKGIDLVNQKFGGSQYVSVLFSGDILSPDALDRMDKYAREIRKLPEVGHIISPAMLFKELSKGVYMPGEPGYNALPKTKAEAVQFLEIFSMSGYGDQVSQLIDYNYENARILVSMTDGSNQTGKKILKSLNEIAGKDPLLVCIAGPGLSKIQISDMVIDGQITSLLIALIIIFILVTLIFKSGTAGATGSIPLLLSILFLFGIMGFLGVPLDIVTALLSSIMIGVGVDYTIHFLWRYKLEYALSRNSRHAISETLRSAGRGIVFNAFSVIVGFAVLMFSEFAPLRFFGVLVVVSIFSCLISALLLIPAIIQLTKPRFLEPEDHADQEGTTVIHNALFNKEHHI
jgi:predicted RND superfamily exporter protein